MDDDVITISEDALDLTAIVGELLLQKGDEPFETFRSVGGGRVVLGVATSEKFRSSIKIFLVENGVIKRGNDLLVLFHLSCIGGIGGGSCGRARKQRRQKRDADHVDLRFDQIFLRRERQPLRHRLH